MSSRTTASAFYVLLLGLVGTVACTAGTSSDAEQSAAAQTAKDASADASDGGADDDAGTSGTCPKAGDVTVADVQQAFDGAWKGPGAPKNVCTQTDIDALKKLFVGSNNVKFADMRQALSGACQSCVFTPSTATTWGPLVDFSGGVYQNYAACYAAVTNDECGKDLAYSDVCLDAVCDETDCGSPQAQQACTKKAMNAGCKTFTVGIQQSCGANLDKLDAQCGNLFQLVAVTCGGGAGSAIDAGSP